MSQHYIAGIATFVAFMFTIAALAACANTEQPAPVAALEAPVASEFHGARIGPDTLRARLDTE